MHLAFVSQDERWFSEEHPRDTHNSYHHKQSLESLLKQRQNGRLDAWQHTISTDSSVLHLPGISTHPITAEPSFKQSRYQILRGLAFKSAVPQKTLKSRFHCIHSHENIKPYSLLCLYTATAMLLTAVEKQSLSNVIHHNY
jgi:hypothetical protein